MQGTMTKKRIAEVYRFLSVASMKKMTDDEKVAFIRLLRTMKPVFNELQDAVNDALEKAKAEMDDESHIMQFVDKAVADISEEPCDVITTVMTKDTLDRLSLSNDWNFAQIDELSDILLKQETD